MNWSFDDQFVAGGCPWNLKFAQMIKNNFKKYVQNGDRAHRKQLENVQTPKHFDITNQRKLKFDELVDIIRMGARFDV